MVIGADRSIGCKYCIAACPLQRALSRRGFVLRSRDAGGRSGDSQYGVECTARGKYRGTYSTVREKSRSAHRIAEGEGSPRYETCIGVPRFAGDLNDPSSGGAAGRFAERSACAGSWARTHPSTI